MKDGEGEGLSETMATLSAVGLFAGCEPDEIVAGMNVSLYFEDPNQDGIRLPNFQTAS